MKLKLNLQNIALYCFKKKRKTFKVLANLYLKYIFSTLGFIQNIEEGAIWLAWKLLSIEAISGQTTSLVFFQPSLAQYKGSLNS